MKIIFTERIAQSFDCIELQEPVERIDLTDMRRTFGECSELWFDPGRMQLCWRDPQDTPLRFEFDLMDHYRLLGKPKPIGIWEAHMLACYCASIYSYERSAGKTFHALQKLARHISAGKVFDVTYEE